ncbi:HAMP domain-containing protein [Pseudogracilibacillus sp. SO30301A]|uniref:HAMP domain-containing protein n=1 Tax=Pseudogracilibacillus sp. SO30301A TaxID=3098291 RepID=UPI00300DFC99
MGKIKDMPLKRAFVTLTFISLLVAILLSILSFWGIDLIRSNIMDKYYSPKNNTVLNPNIVFVDPSIFSQTDQTLLKVVDYLKLAFPLLFSILSIIAASYIFYNIKLKKPLALLKTGAKKISDNNLDFTIDLKSKDEMGDLCSSFETMRKELLNNNVKMWRLMEERKRLNAAFAHDLRTPITVLKGYTDVLESYVPMGKISQEKMISTISLMSDNVVRLEKYVDSMNSIQKLEDTDINPAEVKTSDFYSKT